MAKNIVLYTKLLHRVMTYSILCLKLDLLFLLQFKKYWKAILNFFKMYKFFGTPLF